ncbi:MAG: helix-turn-helix transcriptional regulator [Oscillospiraceae bacterium]|nr:helix-turn-helix transcriptional regulator [Oscillospiraceae bacterium]
MAKTTDDSALKKEFGTIIRTARQRKKMTQEKLSELTGITEVYLRDLEYGNYTATWIIWLRLCTVLDVDIIKFQKKYIIPQITRHERKTDRTKYNM